MILTPTLAIICQVHRRDIKEPFCFISHRNTFRHQKQGHKAAHLYMQVPRRQEILLFLMPFSLIRFYMSSDTSTKSLFLINFKQLRNQQQLEKIIPLIIEYHKYSLHELILPSSKILWDHLQRGKPFSCGCIIYNGVIQKKTLAMQILVP